jgi:hypothetical protein
MRSDMLWHGDVLLYEYKKHSSFFTKGIRLVEGSKFVHAANVRRINGNLFILEALASRTHSYVPFYYIHSGEVVHCFRPKFPIPDVIEKPYFVPESYGYLCIIDSLFNHLMSVITLRKWRFKPLFQKWFDAAHTDCSVLVAELLDLENTTKWCSSNRVVEPDDFSLHPEDFQYLGIVEFL